MMVKNPVPEGIGFPALHTRRRYRHPVDSTPLDRHVAADVLEAGASEELALPVDMVDIDIAVPVGVKIALDVMRAGDAEIWHRLELREEIGEEILAKGDVSIDVADDLE